MYAIADRLKSSKIIYNFMTFKQWMFEWEGFNFTQEPDMVNGPAYADKGVRSKYKGPGKKKDDIKKNSDGNKIQRDFGFEKGDFLLAMNKMMKKMEKN